MKRYLIVLLVLLCVGGSTGCSIQQAEQSNDKAGISDSGKEDGDSRESDSDSKSKRNEPSATPLSIHVFDSGKTVAVTETDRSDIVAAEEEEWVQSNNNLVNGNFIHLYQNGYFYGVEKGGDGPESVTVYDDGQGQIVAHSDLPEVSSMLHISEDSFYFLEAGNHASLKQQTEDETRSMVTSKDGSDLRVCLAPDGIYYADVDAGNRTTYLGLVDTKGENEQQLYALDVEINQIAYYQEACWFVFQEFDDENYIQRLGTLNLSNQEVSVYHLNGDTDTRSKRKFLNGSSSAGSRISIWNGYVYFNASGLKRLNIQNHTVEQIYPKNVDYINYTEDSILFVRNKTLYRMNQDGTEKILELGKDYDGIGGIHVEDQKIYLISYAGAFFGNIDQIDLDGKTIQKIYQGQQFDERMG